LSGLEKFASEEPKKEIVRKISQSEVPECLAKTLGIDSEWQTIERPAEHHGDA
jgi:hypothetical protein